MHIKSLVFLTVITFISGCTISDAVSAKPSKELLQQIETLMPEANKFVNENESIALKNGIPLNSTQLIIAKKVGLKSPEMVRIYYTDKLPFPKNPELATIAKKFGYGAANIQAKAYGHGVWIKKEHEGNKELISHELIHVRQSEQMGKSALTKQYLIQLFIYGYRNAPLEREAFDEQKKYI